MRCNYLYNLSEECDRYQHLKDVRGMALLMSKCGKYYINAFFFSIDVRYKLR